MIMSNKKSKPSKEAKKAYSNIVKKVMESHDVLLKKAKANDKLYELNQATKRINILRAQYDAIVKAGAVS